MDGNQSGSVRAESVPPNVVCTNQSPFLPRAQSEQPNFPTFAQPSNATSPFRQYGNTCQNGQVYRNSGVRLLRLNSLLNSRPIVPAFYETDQSFSNNFLNPSNPDAASVLLNNDPNSPLLNTASAQCQQSPPIFIHHNNNTAATNNANINNLHQQNLTNVAASAAAPTTSTAVTSNNIANMNNSRAYSPQVPALNNQVPPGNRANNYWDNFRR